MTARGALTAEEIRGALACIPPDLPREDWVRIAMALKSELGDDGWLLFDAWSKGGKTYAAKAAQAAWRSVKPHGRTGIGTLLRMAKDHGYQPAARSQRNRPKNLRAEPRTSAAPMHPEGDHPANNHARAAKKALQLWEAASECDTAPYLASKGVAAYGVRKTSQGHLLVPLRDLAGKLWNLQTIAAKAEGKTWTKRYLSGGRKSGLFHWCGDPAGAGVLLIAEGYATAATLYEATGYPTATAFDAGNLAPVARGERKCYPRARILICADDDRDTQARTGHNPGRESARKAAKAGGALVTWPKDLPDHATDFNDLAGHAGPDAVRAQIEAALVAEDKPAAVTPAYLQKRYRVNEQGVWYLQTNNDGSTLPIWICAQLLITGRTRNGHGNDWGFLLKFSTPEGAQREWAVPARMLAGDGTELRAELLQQGLAISTNSKARAQLLEYLQSQNPQSFVRCTNRLGWYGNVYVLPRGHIGHSAESIIYQTDGAVEETLRQRGTLAQWHGSIGKLCIGNSRLVFAASCAYAAILLHWAGDEGGGFHFRGESSLGKSTALRVAASVWSSPDYVQRWRATDNGMEGIAASRSDNLLILDELGQIDGTVAGNCAYMLANGSAKIRGTQSGRQRTLLTWRVLFLSAGEVSLAAHMAESGKKARAGQQARMAEIPIDAGQGYGMFEQLHGRESGAAFSNELVSLTSNTYGTSGMHFLEWAVQHCDELSARIEEQTKRIVRDWIPATASGQVQRVGRRFALVAAAGELATEAGATGWHKGEAESCVQICFRAWVNSRGGFGSIEHAQMMSQVIHFLEQHGDARFTPWGRKDTDHAPRTILRAGFRKPIETGNSEDETHFYVLLQTFRNEICEGFDYRAVLKLLRSRGHLIPDNGRAYDARKRHWDLGMIRCYVIRSTIFADTGEPENGKLAAV